jgi:TolB-like protein
MQKKYYFISLTLLFAMLVFFTTWTPLQAQRRTARTTKNLARIAQLVRNDKLDLARQEVNEILRRDPENQHAREFLAIIHLKNKNYAEAKKEVAWILNKKPNSFQALSVKAKLLQTENKNLAARELYLKSLKQAPAEERDQMKEYLGEILPPSGAKKIDKLVQKAEDSLATAGIVQSTQSDATQSNSRPRIAIFAFEEQSSEMDNQTFGTNLAEMLITALHQTDKFDVIERRQLNKILEEQALSQTGALEEETAVAVGQIMGLNAVVVGNISRLNRRLEADSRLVDLNSGKILAAVNGQIRSEDEARALANDLAQKLAVYANRVPVFIETNSAPAKE